MLGRRYSASLSLFFISLRPPANGCSKVQRIDTAPERQVLQRGLCRLMVGRGTGQVENLALPGHRQVMGAVTAGDAAACVLPCPCSISLALADRLQGEATT